jgi:hypothetical protein
MAETAAFLADPAAHDDERQVHEALGPQQVERREGVEGRHVVVGDDEVPRLVLEGGLHLPGGVDPPGGRLVAAASELPEEQQGVVLRVLHEQHPERGAHFRHPPRGAAWAR